MTPIQEKPNTKPNTKPGLTQQAYEGIRRMLVNAVYFFTGLTDKITPELDVAIVGGGIPPAGGYALASKLRGTGDVGVACFGDGASQIGAFHEAAALARAWELPLILLLVVLLVTLILHLLVVVFWLTVMP